MNMPTPETVTDDLSLQKYDCISLNTTQRRIIDVVRQQKAEVDVGLLIIG